MLGSIHLGKRALVVDRIMYYRDPTVAQSFSGEDLIAGKIINDKHLHPDEYSCRLKLLDPGEDSPANVMVRAKWIKRLSSVDATKTGD